jgi:hypothetical protein
LQDGKLLVTGGYGGSTVCEVISGHFNTKIWNKFLEK